MYLLVITMENAQDMFINANDFQTENVYYAKPKLNPSGGKNVGIMDSSIKKPLVLSTPLMLTWGINEWVADDGIKKTYDLSLQFPRKEDDNYEKCQKFLVAMKAFEKKVIEDAFKNSKEWFGKKHGIIQIVEALFTPMLRYPKTPDGEPDLTRSPSLRVKLPYWDGKFNCELYNIQGDLLFPDSSGDVSPMTLITKGQNVAAMIKCGGIWFANGKFGVTWKLVQSVVQPRLSLRGRCHIQLDTGDKAVLEREAAKVVEEEKDTVVATQVEDSSDEEEEEQPEEALPEEAQPEPATTPEPVATEEPKKPKKRIVRKKKSAAEE